VNSSATWSIRDILMLPLDLVRGRALLRIEKRLSTPRWMGYVVPIISIIVALLLGAILLAAAGVNPLETYQTMLAGAFASTDGLAGTAVKAIPLILCGLGVALAFRTLLWNIGAEGQLFMGAFAAAGVALYVIPNAPPLVLIPTMLVAGFLAGGLWGLIPGALKGLLGVNEIITSLMLNYVAILWTDYLIYGPWRDPAGYGFPGTAPFEAARFPRIPGTRVHLGLLVGVLAAAVIAFALARTRWGYETRVIGENQKAARYAGINLAKNILLVMFLSGGLAGLAGASELCGLTTPRLQMGLSPGYGYTAIIVAWLARLNPWAILLVAFLFAGLLVGGDRVQIVMHLPRATAYILQGIVLFAVLGGEIFGRYQVRIARGGRP
jgi:simple sugar transport system permease protein